MKRTASVMIAIVALVLFSCGAAEHRHGITSSKETFIDTVGGSCPFLTRDNKNNIILSWIKQADSARSIFCYAISKDEGSSFSDEIEIPGSTNVHPHGENMPKVIFKPSGEIMAVWGADNPNPRNKYAGMVCYSQSFDEGKTWSVPKKITQDTASFDQRYFDLALLPNGEAAIVWLDNRKQGNKEGSGLFYAITNGKGGFGQERLISGPCCQCCRTDLFIDKSKNIHVLYRAIINDSIRDMVHIVSTDEGKSFTEPRRISNDNWVINGCPHTGPALAENNKGLHFTWFTGGNDAGIYYNSSMNNGKQFSERKAVGGRQAMHCQIVSLAGDNLVIAWNENFLGGNSRIGFETRSPGGSSTSRDYVTSETSHASFPVVCPVNQTTVMLAYTEHQKDKDQVAYKLVSLNPE